MAKTSKAKAVEKAARKMKFPYLFVFVAALFGVDLVIPDVLPFIDEVMLGLLTALLGAWRTRREPALPPGDDTKTPELGTGQGKE